MEDYKYIPCIASFVEYLARSERSLLTIKNYALDLKNFAQWFEKNNNYELQPEKITPTDLREYKQHMLQQMFKPKTVNRKLATLNCFLKWAALTGLVPDSRRPIIPQSINEVRNGPRWLNNQEKRKLVRAIEEGGKLRDISIVKLLLNTGLRVQELCALTWRDIAISERQGKLTVRNGKGHKQRQIPLNKDARKALTIIGYRGHRGEEAPIFKGQRGYLTPRGVQLLLKKYVDVAGLDNVSPHSLRHTFCKTLLDSGRGLHEVAALAGHESLNTTRFYCEPSMKDLEEAVTSIEEEE
jgi:integrase/recombinase XerC